MDTREWKVYNHVLLMNVPPHKNNIKKIPSGFYMMTNNIVMARWTEGWDLDRDTGWYYCIKDTPINLEKLSKKKRYRIKHSLKLFDIRIINPIEYVDRIVEIQKSAFSQYPKNYRPKSITKTSVLNEINDWNRNKSICIGSFVKDTNDLCGYSVGQGKGKYVDFCIQKAMAEYEKKGLNLALTYGFCKYWLSDNKYKYILDGERPIRHKTNFQEWLCSYFGFRYVYCRLRVKYNPMIGIIVKILYPLRGLIEKIGSNSIAYNISCVLKQEEIVRGKN